MARLKGKQIQGVTDFVTSQTADFTRGGASETEFPSEAAIARTFVKFSDLREERPTVRPVKADSPAAQDRQIPLAQAAVLVTGNINDEIEVFVNGLRVSSDSLSGSGKILTLSQLAYDVDKNDELVIRYKSY